VHDLTARETARGCLTNGEKGGVCSTCVRRTIGGRFAIQELSGQRFFSAAADALQI